MIKRLLLLTIFSFTLTALAFGQLFEDFEDGTKNSYAAGTTDFASGTWYLDDALIGTDERDRKNGNQSVRIRGYIQMNFDFPDGASGFQFLASNSGFSNDVGGVLQVYYSTDSGGNWSAIGDEFTLSDTLEEYNVLVEETGDIRFRIEKKEGNRVNVDDILIEPFIELSDDPTISVRRGNDTVSDNEEIQFSSTAIGSSRSVELQITNNGVPDLEIEEVTLSDGQAFSVSSLEGSIASRETETFTIAFEPQSVGDFVDALTISTNDPSTPEFTIHVSGTSVSEDDISTIASARELDFGTRVTVSGRVTVADEFSGPVFIQDQTAGIAVYYVPMHSAVQRGDSVVVTGPVTEFNPTGSNQGTFLMQIAAHDGDSDISFDIIDTDPVEIEPQVITLADMNAGGYESQLVTVNAVSFTDDGVFQGGQNYEITDPTDNGQLRIDQNATDLVNASIPTEVIEITGVIDRFSGTYQLKPRDSEDIAIEVYEPVGDDISKDQTFDVVTWNIEWFGNSGNGPDDLDLQMNNVIEVIRTIDADLYALQEIADEQRFFALVDSLEGYDGFWADYITQTQKMAYIYRTDVIQKVDSGEHVTNQDAYDWAFRLPLWFEFDATVNDVTRRIRAYNTHAKAISDQESYDRRVMASTRMKEYLDDFRTEDNVIFIGDYNDGLVTATFENRESPYQNFVDDENYYTITYDLEARGFASYIAGTFRSMLDHITVTNDLIDDHIDGAQRVENPNYIGSFISTTSDHAPVWTRFDFSRSLVSVEDEILAENPTQVTLDQNYPNPFNPTTNISFTLPERSDVTLKVYDVMGREVATLANRQSFTGGNHAVTFDASSLSSGMYIYRLSLDNGMNLTRRMMLVK
ncbi:T9SS C-terminal target domain-containing protein [Rhodohalobacter sp. SW132]|uniref:Ig-like domain-containing protein n=1 Tax=Rhodohalobacter sp. SW132 TaxID=2293433 RepID=UPI000E285EDE|nr:DUF5689 domain-containing protein [Rhodohalobacter sp. SW132]REL38319.1 T9SS C-terminal target domain-containing protein [Rhodohalobacter sp. SW132]